MADRRPNVQLQPAWDKTFREVVVPSGSWAEIVSENPLRRYLLIQNRDVDALMEIRAGDGKDVGLTLDFGATAKIGGGAYEMTEEAGNLDTQAWFAMGASGDATVLVIEAGSVPAPPPADKSSSSSSSSSSPSSSSSSSSSSSTAAQNSSSSSSSSSSTAAQNSSSSST